MEGEKANHEGKFVSQFLQRSYIQKTHKNNHGQSLTFACTLKFVCNVYPVGIVLHFFWDPQPPASIIIINC